jgi:adenylyl- and sulfurtransferase ThiI
MKYTHLLLRPGEIFLKGKNIGTFERKLVENIKKLTLVNKVKKLRGRFIVNHFIEHEKLKTVFGLTSYSPAIKVENDLEVIKKSVLKLVEGYKKKTSFRVETKRSDKTFPIKSPDLNVIIGKHLEENSEMEFKFKNQDLTIYIEINQDGVYLFTEIVRCFGGLPTGVEGKVLLLIESSASLLAGLSFMKRGCDVIPLAYSKQDISLLQKYSPKELKLKIVKDVKELNQFATENHLDTLVVGDNFDNKKDYQRDLLIFKPLIAFSDKEIEEKLEKFNF